MSTSAAAIVKKYLEKYAAINVLKTRQNKYKDQPLARNTLAIAYDIIHAMNALILINEGNNYPEIKRNIRKHVGILQRLLKKDQSFFESWFSTIEFPKDFEKCLKTAWCLLQNFEKKYPPSPGKFKR